MNAERYRALKDRNLTQKTNFLLITILIVAFTVISLFTIVYVRGLLRQQTEKRAGEIAFYYAKINTLPLLRKDYFAVESNTIELLKNEDIVFAEVYDETLFRVSSKFREDFEETGSVMQIREAIFHPDYPYRIGTVAIGLSMDSANQTVKTLILTITLVLFSAVLIIALSQSLIVKLFINKPLNYILKSAVAVGNGELNRKIVKVSNDEIGSLADSIENMRIKLKNSLSFIKNIIHSMPSVLISLDEEGKVSEWNKAAEIITKIKAEEIIGKKLLEVTKIFNDFLEDYDKVLNSERPIYFYKKQLDIDRENISNISLYPLTANGAKGVVLKIDDITEEERKEIQLRQIQKMESIGTLASGLAHDFNNVLVGIMGTLSIIKFRLEKNETINREELKDNLNTMESSSKRASDLVEQLMSLSKDKKLSLENINLNESIKHIYKVCRNTFHRSVEINLTRIVNDAYIEADATQIEQVLLNLCINSYHAMTIMRSPEERQGGILSIKLEKVFADEHFCSNYPEAKKDYYWLLSISDTGVGIPREVLPKIFDPFFSTKDKDRGTGLGLPMAYNIVRQHKGFIDVYSEVGKGSRFNLYFPVVAHKKEMEKEKIKQEVLQGKGKILIIDDEDVNIQTAKSILQEVGYQVYTSYSGEDGIEIFKKNVESIDLILLDLVMPKKSGEETYKELKKLVPDVKVLFASGFEISEQIETWISKGNIGFIQKPYTLKKLAEKIYDLINV